MRKRRDEAAPQADPTPAASMRRVTVPKEPPTGTTRPRRRPIAGTLVGIEAPSLGEHRWVADAVDLSAEGMGLVLPDELAPGTEVLLTFRLGEGYELARVPATVLHCEPQAGGGGVAFGSWSMADRLSLLEFLVRWYEVDGEARGAGGQDPDPAPPSRS